MPEPKPSTPSGKPSAGGSTTPPAHAPLSPQEKADWIGEAVRLAQETTPQRPPQTPDEEANSRLA